MRAWSERRQALDSGTFYPSDLDPIYDDLCRIYLDASMDQRARLPLLVADTEVSPHAFERTRDWIAARNRARLEIDRLQAFLGRSVERARGIADGWMVRHAFVAAAIMDLRPDYRDIILDLQLVHER